MYPRAYNSKLSCFFLYCKLRLSCVVLVQDCIIPNYSQTTPLRPTMLREPISLLFNQHPGYYPGPKQPGHEANHSPPSIAKIRNSCSYTSTPPTCLYGVDRTDIFHSITLSFYALIHPRSFPSHRFICCLCQYKFVLHVSKIYMQCILYHILN